MDVQLPKVPKGAFWVAAALTVYGINRGVSDVARAGGDAAAAAGRGFSNLYDTAENGAEAVRRKWENAGHGTRAALPFVVLFAGLILWKKG